ncbi:MAG TPA: Hsp20/alpha crystallin family protein [Gemmataceae bacterium]|nr:Hsp20/alpha crystallin family protein [Gemmataceae bacterium]
MAENALKTTNGNQAHGETTRGGHFFTPRVDIYETDEELTLVADVPGVTAEDVDLRFERGELILQGRVKPRQRPGLALLSEYEEGDFYRVFQIHESIDSTRIGAECKNGELIVHLPKAEAAKPRQVQVRAN